MRLSICLVVFAALALATLARPEHAPGHGIVIDSTPKHQETVTAPKQLVIRFNSRLEKRLCSVTLLGPQQTSVLLIRQETDAPPDTLIYLLPEAQARPVPGEVEGAGRRRPRHRRSDPLHCHRRGRGPMTRQPRTRASRRLIAWLGAAVLAASGAPETADAHAVLVKSAPAGRATLAEAPSRVQLWFSERIEPAFSSLSVWSAEGTQVDQRDGRVAAENPKELSVTLPPLSPGSYRVRYRVLSVDGHIVDSSFTFSVKPKAAAK